MALVAILNEDILPAMTMSVWHTAKHLGSSHFNLDGQQFLIRSVSPSEIVCGVPSLHLWEVVSVSQPSNPFNKLIWCPSISDPDLFKLIDPALLRNKVIHRAV